MEVGEKEIRQRFSKVLKKAEDLGLTVNDFQHLQSLGSLTAPKLPQERKPWGLLKKIWPGIIIAVSIFFLCMSCIFLTDWPITKFAVTRMWFDWNSMDIDEEICLVDAAESFIDVFRPPVNCQMCRGLKSVEHLKGISQTEFEKRYAYSGRPVVISDGTKNWTAPEHFSFNFFRSIYSEDSPVIQNSGESCQFFPYKTKFHSLSEVFSMSEDRAQMKEGSEPWYVGWSNCDSSAASVLRQHYNRPYFLPAVAESSRLDWIFMGSPGYGAHMHIDNVQNPSWQAQITGAKLWTLEPPPECYLECERRIQVTVDKGEIIVLDTNIWFHSTKIVGKDMSITIGSEYD